MGRDHDLESLIARYDPARRETLRRILLGAAVYTAPVIASYSMKSLGGDVQAQSIFCNQTQGGTPCPSVSVPVDSGVALIAAAGAVGAAGAIMLRRRRRKDDDTAR